MEVVTASEWTVKHGSGCEGSLYASEKWIEEYARGTSIAAINTWQS